MEPDSEYVRAALATALKRALASATAEPRQSSVAAISGRSVKSEAPISFTQPLLRSVLAGAKTQTRRPIRPIPARLVNGVPLEADGSPIAPPANVGGRLWVREQWARLGDGRFVYGLDGPVDGVRWVSSRFMPRIAARTFLRVDAIEVGRLSSIDEADAKREGAPVTNLMFGAREWFIGTWDAIYGDGEFAWVNDPWAWTITFQVEAAHQIEP